MPTLTKPHRTLLESVTRKARILAETACRAALENLAVHEKSYRPHMTSPEVRDLRNRLRARGRALGDSRLYDGTQEIRRLTELAAYEHWHRLLFTRFLTENQLLLTDEANGSVPVTLAECEELAPELGARDGFELACRFASLVLPGVFRRDDPVLDLTLALNEQVELRKLLTSLPAEIFRTDDALGWTYQFWQAQRKDEINASGKKIGADELPAVTQLFTEDYMVEFLLHNTIGAWWAGKLGPIQAASEAEARAQAGLPARDGIPGIAWTYLRFTQDDDTQAWHPAAGTLEGWPERAAEIRVLDPCMGSGHFLVFALPLLARLRIEEEGVTARGSVAAVIRENLHGLEIDERCTQIAAFNVALAAWKLAGYQALPQPHLACCGLAPNAKREDWLNLTAGTPALRFQMGGLYDLFQRAPVLGSLINPRADKAANYGDAFHQLQPLLEMALAKETKDDAAYEMAVTALGMARAAQLLADRFTLVTTNVPYLGQIKHSELLKLHILEHWKVAKSDLALAFLLRCHELAGPTGTVGLVLPQGWLTQSHDKEFRTALLRKSNLSVIARLGSGAFASSIGQQVMMFILGEGQTPEQNYIQFVDVLGGNDPNAKCRGLVENPLSRTRQREHLKASQSQITAEDTSVATTLGSYAYCLQGLSTGDKNRFERYFWEVPSLESTWDVLHETAEATSEFDGMQTVIRWENESGELASLAEELKHLNHAVQSWRRGKPFWRKRGVAINRMGSLNRTTYIGDKFSADIGVIVPKNANHLAAIYAFCFSDEFLPLVRSMYPKTEVPPSYLVNVPFDLTHWQKVATDKYPHGLPKPFSRNPMQWLFNGQPGGSKEPLHVAVARLLGYRWPRQTGSSFPDCPVLDTDGLEPFADEDGIVCLSPLKGEQPAAARLRRLLTAAVGTFDEKSLLAAAGLKGSKSRTIEDWLRDEFFEQHVKLSYDRPFIWHVWDGRLDGFHALVNYHRLDHANLQKLTYSYLGDWIRQQEEDARADKPGAAARLGAARALQTKLALILEGEAPLDIFVRWKPLKAQAQGWRPDLNDGIRQNIRPFLLVGDVAKRGAGLFRAVPLTLKDKDRGTEPARAKEDYPWFWCESEPGTDPEGGNEFVGARWNQVHLTLARKQKAGA